MPHRLNFNNFLKCKDEANDIVIVICRTCLRKKVYFIETFSFLVTNLMASTYDFSLRAKIQAIRKFFSISLRPTQHS